LTDFDYLIVGAGFAGSVLAERLATQLGKKVLVVDRRNHIGGNAFDYFDENGINVHKYGPHLFHTNSERVWDYLSQFTGWYPYEHRVMAVVGDKKIPLPFNFNSIDILFPGKHGEILQKDLMSRFGYGSKVPILKLLEESDSGLKKLAEFIYDNVFLGYNLKQWEMKPEELDPSVTARVPVLAGRDDRYFHDRYQALPDNGYTAMFRRMLSFRGIEIILNTDYRRIIGDVKFNRLIYTGEIDAFFDYIYGELPYRSIRFESAEFEKDYFQECGQINYPNDFKYLRINEYKYFSKTVSSKTSITYEFSEGFERGKNEPFYPIPCQNNHKVYDNYLKESLKISDSVKFIGRLADYRYFNMDQIIARALTLFDNISTDR